MFKTGIVSVTFRQKTIDEIIALASESGLDAIEIGSDVHAPKEKLDELSRIRKIAKENKIGIVSYGSYYKLGQYEDPQNEFSSYIAAAKLLGTSNIRIWAGVKNSQDVSEKVRKALTDEARSLANLAKAENMTISFEYHGGTLTNTADSAIRLIKEIGMENVSLYWQPNQSKDLEFNITALAEVLPFVSNVHVFAWDARSGPCIKYPLADHSDAWKAYLDILASDKKPRSLLLEFVKDDLSEQFITDAKTLNEWRKSYAV